MGVGLCEHACDLVGLNNNNRERLGLSMDPFFSLQISICLLYIIKVNETGCLYEKQSDQMHITSAFIFKSFGKFKFPHFEMRQTRPQLE